MERARRTDARTNRERILTVAEEVFGRGGDTASTEEVARLAGVGIATVFRHFPTKTALLRAVLIGRLNRLRDCSSAAPARGASPARTTLLTSQDPAVPAPRTTSSTRTAHCRKISPRRPIRLNVWS